MLCRPCRPWTMPPTVCPMNDRSADNRPDGGPPSRPCRGRSSTLSLSSAPLGLLRGSPVLCGARFGYLPFFFGLPGRDLYPPFAPLCGMQIASFLGWRLLQHDDFHARIVRIIVAINEQMAATARAAGGNERVGLAGAAARRRPRLDFRAMELARLLALFDRLVLIGSDRLVRNRAAGHGSTPAPDNHVEEIARRDRAPERRRWRGLDRLNRDRGNSSARASSPTTLKSGDRL